MSGTIFITGFPGFIASRLVARLADEGNEFYLLVQPAFVELADREIDQICGQSGLTHRNFRIMEGDITRGDLGLSASDSGTVRENAEYVFHLAAIYDLAVRREAAMLINFEGTNRVNEFVRGLRKLRRYNYVSTCYVAGKRDGLILETELRHQAGFRNYYEETKYLAECEVENLKSAVPVTIFRPSVVCGDSETGETAKYDGIYYLILYLLKQPNLLSLINIGNDEVKLNLVPVDFVVNAMAELFDSPSAEGKTLHLADPEPLSTRELFEVISRTLTGRGSVMTAPPKLVQSTLSLSVSPGLTGLPLSAVPYFFIEQIYDTAQASALLSSHGVACPPLANYVENLIGFVKEHRTLSGQDHAVSSRKISE